MNLFSYFVNPIALSLVNRYHVYILVLQNLIIELICNIHNTYIST